MFGILFRVEANPGKRQELIDLLRWSGEVGRDQEPGTLRFEFYQDPEDENRLYVYEAYRDRAAFEAHQQNEPFKRWIGGAKDELGTNLQVLFYDEAVWSPVG
jgi:(4S)-4-hydroxy-5-phosphonooxypentane-2,3-dione isomerase